MREGLLDNNPVIGTNPAGKITRARAVRRRAKNNLGALGSDDYSTIVRLLMLTGQRADEIAALRWYEVVGDQIVLPPERTKNCREHIIPLATSRARHSRSPHAQRRFVFGRRQGRPFRGWGTCKAGLDRRIRAAAPSSSTGRIMI